MNARRLILVRHGESVWNVERRVQGHTCLGLTALGHEQAERTAKALAPLVRDAVVVTSDLGRCRDTAAPLIAELGATPRVDAALRERNFGTWEGLTREDLQREDPERFARWRSGEDVIAEVGGESDTTLRERGCAMFRQLLGLSVDVADGADADEGADTVVAFTHGGTIWYGVHELLRLSDYRLGSVENASVTELVIGGRGPSGVDLASPRLARFNETAHL
jgi:probable phosphoglycerate mutase